MKSKRKLYKIVWTPENWTVESGYTSESQARKALLNYFKFHNVRDSVERGEYKVKPQ